MLHERYLITDMPWDVSYDEAFKKLHVMEDDEDDFKQIFAAVLKLIKPVLYWGIDEIESNDGHVVTVNGQKFVSRVMAVNVEDCKYLYPYVMTSGRAAFEYCESLDDELFRYWASQVCELALRSSGSSGHKMVLAQLGYDKLYSVNPGSLIDLPICNQKPLFDLLGDVFEKTGIELTPSFLMHPVKSGSGIWYYSNKHYTNCMLCPRNGCPNRKSPFDSEMFKREYGE